MTSNRIRPILAGVTYFITSVTYQRRRWFSDPALAQIVVDQLDHYRTAYGYSLHSYAVLPVHYHAVLTPGPDKTVSQILHAVNSYTATLIAPGSGHAEKTRVWQGNAWDTVARDEGMFWRMISYTLLNPWRAGLVPDPLQPYPYSDIDRWRKETGDEFLLDIFALVRDGREFGETSL